MQSLKEKLGSGPRRQLLLDDACHVLDQEVEAKGGLSGLAIKAAFKVVKGVQPGFIRQAIDHLLDDFLDALDPLFQEAVASSSPISEHIVSKKGQMADALLQITDRRAERSAHGLLKKTYGKLRSLAKDQVETAAPRVGQLLAKHAA